MILKKIIVLVTYLLNIFILLSFLNAGCLSSPSYIEVLSGSMHVGEFDSNYIDLGNVIYVKSDIDTYPIGLNFYFEDIDEDCFGSVDDVQVRLFQSGIYISASSITTQANTTVAKFNFDIATISPSSFISDYLIKTKEDFAGEQGSISFQTDDDSPIFTQLGVQPAETIIEDGTEIVIDYDIIDSKVGLKSLVISGGISETINFEGNYSYSSQIVKNLSSSQTFTLTVKDMLNNEIVESVYFEVDNTAPSINSLDIDEYYINDNSYRAVTFVSTVQDSSFALVDDVPIITGDFSAINSQDVGVVADCVRVKENDEQYECTWDIEIDSIVQTSTVNLVISAKDSVGHQIEKSFSKEVFYDSEGPVIREFYLENSVGQVNIFRTDDENTTIYLEFEDESLEYISDMKIYPDFDGLEFFLTADCSVDNNIGVCVWNMEDSLSKYSGVEQGNVEFLIEIVDMYDNVVTQSLNLSYNNEKPLISSNIEIIETEDVKDKIIKSGEEIDFRIYISDDNLLLDSDFIFADFSSIDFNDGMEQKGASCSAYNESFMQCDFTGIVVENGYMEKNVTFYVMDTAGNVAIVEKNIKIFKVGDEVFSSFKISDITITNTLNRHVVVQGGANAWFEGIIELQDSNEDIKLINYYLKSCNDSDMNPVLLGERLLYPDETVQGDVDNEPDNDFVLKVEVNTHPNYEDLNEDTLKCTMSILKRDDDTVYEAELVEFNLVFNYYDLPHDTLLKANAESILGKAEDADFIGSWFDSVWDIYETLDKACNLVNTINGITGGIETAWVSISLLLSATVGGKGIAKAGDAVITPVTSTVSGITGNKVVVGICDFVACRINIVDVMRGEKDEEGNIVHNSNVLEDTVSGGFGVGNIVDGAMGNWCTTSPDEKNETK